MFILHYIVSARVPDIHFVPIMIGLSPQDLLVNLIILRKKRCSIYSLPGSFFRLCRRYIFSFPKCVFFTASAHHVINPLEPTFGGPLMMFGGRLNPGLTCRLEESLPVVYISGGEMRLHSGRRPLQVGYIQRPNFFSFWTTHMFCIGAECLDNARKMPMPRQG